MRKWIKIAIWTLLLAVGVVICVVRWQAWFGIPDEPVWTGDSLSFRFNTFGQDSVPGFVCTQEGWRDTLSPQSLDILVLGDIHNRLSQADYDTLSARVPYADAVAQVGDWMDRGQEYYHQLLLREWTASGLAGIPVINCPGNHEYNKHLRKGLDVDWCSWFDHPDNGPVDQIGTTYYVDFPQLRFIVIDTNPLNRTVYLTRTLTWLREAMNSAGGRYTVVMMHHPVISNAKGRSNPLLYATFRRALGQTDAVFAGHDHSYMRRMPFIVLNTAGKNKPMKERHKAEITDEAPVYSIISIPSADTEAGAPMVIRTYHLSDGKMIDSIYVDHNGCDSTCIATTLR